MKRSCCVWALSVVLGGLYPCVASAYLLGEYGGETLGGLAGPSGLNTFMNQWQTYKTVAGFHKDSEKKGSVTIITDPKRLEVEALMQSASDLVNDKKYPEALAKLQTLENSEGKKPEDTFFMNRMRVVIASITGDDAMLASSLQAVVATGKVPAAEQSQFLEELSYLYAKQRDFPKTIEWASRSLKEGGNDADMRKRLIGAYYLNGDFSAAAHELSIDIAAAEAAGKKPSKRDLHVLAGAYLKAGDQNGYAGAIEKSVAYYPDKQNWTELLHTILSKPDLDGDLVLEVCRLMFRTGQFSTSADYTNMAQLAAKSGYPAEAKAVLEKGFQAGVLGKGADGPSQKQLLDLVSRRAADESRELASEESRVLQEKNSSALAQIGYAYVTKGEYDKGIELMRQAIAMGGMQSTEHARLRLGVALGAAGHTAEAIQTLKAVQGSDGAADLARYWTIQYARPHA